MSVLLKWTKWIALAILVIQNTTLVMIMRYSLTQEKSASDARYSTSTAVFMSELIKLVSCFIAVAFYCRKRSGMTLDAKPVPFRARYLRTCLRGISLKVAVPAILYTNNLQYIAISHLDPATFQVTYQLKILTTAMFSVTLLKRQISKEKWIALLLLTCGVALCQMPAKTASSVSRTWSQALFPDLGQMKGLIAVLAACVTSGLAGTYVELILKSSPPASGEKSGYAKEKSPILEEPSSAKMWTTNLHLSLFSLLPALAGMIMTDGASIWLHGFFAGWSWIVLATVLCQALGGLVVAYCVTYADNIVKIFATSLSLLLSAALSIFYFNVTLTDTFHQGAILVLGATWLYNTPGTLRFRTPSWLRTSNIGGSEKTKKVKFPDHV